MHAKMWHIDGHIREEMRRYSWRDESRCPSFDELRLLKCACRGLGGRPLEGELIVHKEVASEVCLIFDEIYNIGFPIESMQRIDVYLGDDNLSMAANNTSAFNFRCVDGTDRLSKHALGRAIDINPLWNPWLRGTHIDPPSGVAHIDRTSGHPGYILSAGPVVDIFRKYGWVWGGVDRRTGFTPFSKKSALMSKISQFDERHGDKDQFHVLQRSFLTYTPRADNAS